MCFQPPGPRALREFDRWADLSFFVFTPTPPVRREEELEPSPFYLDGRKVVLGELQAGKFE